MSAMFRGSFSQNQQKNQLPRGPRAGVVGHSQLGSRWDNPGFNPGEKKTVRTVRCSCSVFGALSHDVRKCKKLIQLPPYHPHPTPSKCKKSRYRAVLICANGRYGRYKDLFFHSTIQNCKLLFSGRIWVQCRGGAQNMLVLVLVSGAQYLVPDTRCQVPGIR